MTVLRGAAATDVGRVRQMNEDRYLVGDGIYAVADGVGGHQAGEVAAEASLEALAEEFTERTVDGLIDAVQAANRSVWRLAQERAERRGMGTTITALALVDEDGEEQLAIANVGDSRAYLLQEGDLLQVTQDHSLVEELVREGQLTPEEAQVHPQRSIITRALGMEAEIAVDAWCLTPYAGDRVLLCSDGLTNEVSTDRIAATLRQLTDPQEAAHELVRQARSHGGNDNITVVVVDVVEDGTDGPEGADPVARAAPTAAPGNTTQHDDGDRTTKIPVARWAGEDDPGDHPGDHPGDGPDDDPGDHAGDGPGGPARLATPAMPARGVGANPPAAGPPGRSPAGRTGTRPAGARLPGARPDGRTEGGPGTGSGAPHWTERAAERRPPLAGQPRPRRFTWRVGAFLVAFVAVLGVVAASVAWYARSAYFVSLTDADEVAVYQGRPGGFLWFEPTLVERAGLDLAEVLPAKHDELRAGKEEPSRADADRYVENLRRTAVTTTVLPPFDPGPATPTTTPTAGGATSTTQGPPP